MSFEHGQIDGVDCTETEVEFSELIADGITQKVTRSNRDGMDSIVGLFRCDFKPGQNHFVLNIPIHPPMSEIPEVEAMVSDENVRSRITNRERFGIRLELNLNTGEPLEFVFVETVISSTQ